MCSRFSLHVLWKAEICLKGVAVEGRSTKLIRQIVVGTTNHILLRIGRNNCTLLVTEPDQMSCIQGRKDSYVGGYAQASLSMCFIIVTRKDYSSILTAVTDLFCEWKCAQQFWVLERTGGESLRMPHYGLRKVEEPMQRWNPSCREYKNGIHIGSDFVSWQMLPTSWFEASTVEEG